MLAAESIFAGLVRGRVTVIGACLALRIGLKESVDLGHRERTLVIDRLSW